MTETREVVSEPTSPGDHLIYDKQKLLKPVWEAARERPEVLNRLREEAEEAGTAHH